MIVTVAGTYVAATAERTLVVFASIFRQAPRSTPMAPLHELNLTNLAETREHPFTTTSRNLSLSDSLDSAEFELDHCVRHAQTQCAASRVLVVDATPPLLAGGPFGYVDLVKRMSPRLDVVRGNGWHPELHGAFTVQSSRVALGTEAPCGLVGEVYLEAFGDAERAALSRAVACSVQGGMAPLLLAVAPVGDSERQLSVALDALRALQAQSFPLSRVAISGLFSQPRAVAVNVLAFSRDVLLVVDVTGGVPFTHPAQTEPHADDFAVAAVAAEALATGARLAVGCNLVFATQLRKFGGSSLSTVFPLLRRVDELLARACFAERRAALDALCSGNAAAWLAYWQPPEAAPVRAETLIPCVQCGALRKVSFYWFDLGGHKFCSATCLRTWKAANAPSVGDDGKRSGTGGGDASRSVGVWGVQVGSF